MNTETLAPIILTPTEVRFAEFVGKTIEKNHIDSDSSKPLESEGDSLRTNIDAAGAEVAFGKFFNLFPVAAFDAGPAPEHFDLVWPDGRTVDVKNSYRENPAQVFVALKYAENPADIFAFMMGDVRRGYRFLGFLYKDDVFQPDNIRKIKTECYCIDTSRLLTTIADLGTK